MNSRDDTGIDTAPMAASESLYEQKPKRRNFASRSQQPRLSVEEAARQGRIVTSALRHFPTASAAMTYLNNEQPDMGRPLDVAIGSEAGLVSVETALTLISPSLR
jgi:uncharacterized protein (DUF2384 family)